MGACARALADRRLLAWAAVWAAVSLLAFGLVSAIIPNPVFGRQIPPEPFAIVVWVVSAPLMGLLMATYVAPYRGSSDAAPVALPGLAGGAIAAGPSSAADAAVMAGPGSGAPTPAAEARGTTLGTIAGFGAFLAIGCPVCNKIALVLLGTNGALTIFAPIQPVIGAISLALLAGTLAWRLRSRATGGACAVRPA